MISINLIPKDILVARSRHRRAMRWLSACGLAVTMLTVVAGVDWLNRSQLYKLSNRRDALRDKLVEVRKNLDNLTAVGDELKLQIERASALHAKRPWSGMLMMTASHLGDAMWLTRFATIPEVPQRRSRRARDEVEDKEEEGKEETVQIDAPRKLRLEGFALEAGDATLLVAALQKEQIFNEVKLVQTQRHEERESVRFKFEIICSW
ncbi:MAG: PilN domain-containing protein [Phycisphaerae bacterium]